MLFCLTNGQISKAIQLIIMYDTDKKSNHHIREAKTSKCLAIILKKKTKTIIRSSQ